jgi:hypothetical protein
MIHHRRLGITLGLQEGIKMLEIKYSICPHFEAQTSRVTFDFPCSKPYIDQTPATC